MAEDHGTTPAQYGRIPRLRGFLPLNNEDTNPMALHGHGTLTNLIRSRSNASLHGMGARRPSSFIGKPDDEERVGEEEHLTLEERRASVVLNNPQMRSMRLIGNSNPRYRWQQYWKTEEELKKMKKPMFAPLPPDTQTTLTTV